MADYCEVLREKRVKTRKEHYCMWCQEGIQAGSEDILYKCSVFDGSIYSEWWHPECEIALKYVLKHSPEDVEEWFTSGDYARAGIVNRNN